MASRTAILTTDSPAPRPCNSQAVICNGMIYCSGSIGVSPLTKKLVEGGVYERTIQCLQNLRAILEAGGSDISNAVKVNVFLTSMDNFAEMNRAYESVFINDPKPGRTCVAVYQLPTGTDVEVELIAALGARPEHHL